MKLQLAKGVKDTDPEDKIVRQEVGDTLRKVFELYGYAPLETPILERYDVLSAKYAGGSEILKETFKLKDQGSRDLALRYDLTVPFCRYVGMNPNLKMPFKRYQIGRVFRDGPIKLGRYREFWQCDIDAVGVKSMKIDAEFIGVFNEVFNRLGLKVVVKVNNRKILDAIMKKVGIKDPGQAILVMDKMEKIGVSGVKRELKELKLKDKQIDEILRLFSVSGTNKAKVKFLREELGECCGLDEIEEVMKYTSSFVFDVSLARGLAYYTGTIYEVFLKKGAIKSSLASGGRYDNLVGGFLGSGSYPALGISFGLSVISDVLKSGRKTNTKVYVIPIKTDCSSIVKELRSKGVNTDVDYSSRGISKNLNYANSLGIPFVLFVGAQELKKGKFKLKDMESGKESYLSLSSIVKKVL
tara:strand:+ start:77 stop:1312 length:1236 start_codon:yes stop_codon:yes gene_type:complete